MEKIKKFMRTSKTAWTKSSWKKTAKEGYKVKGGPKKGKIDGSWRLFDGKYFNRNNYQVRNNKVKESKSYWKSRDYLVRTKKDGKFTSIYVRPNFEKKKRK